MKTSEKNHLITGYESARLFIVSLLGGEVSADEVREAWRQFKEAADNIRADLAKLSKSDLLKLAGPRYRSADTKPQLVKGIFSGMESYFNPSDSLSYGISYSGTSNEENRLAAMEEAVAGWTDEIIREKAAAREAAKAAREKALTNPETVSEWEAFVWKRGASKAAPEEMAEFRGLNQEGRAAWIMARGERLLTPEELAKWDAVRGIDRKAQAERKREQAAQVPGVAVNTEAEIIETTHTQKGHALFVARLSDRVPRDVFNDLLSSAKRLGGYYSSYAKDGATPGFQFKNRADAEQFIAITKGESVDRSEAVATRVEEKKNLAADRLIAAANTLEEKARIAFQKDRKANTRKRATQAAHAEVDARRDKAMADTMRNLAAAMQAGDATHLDGIRTASHVRELEKQAQAARRRFVHRANLGYTERLSVEGGPILPEHIDTAEMPWPYLDKGTVLKLVSMGESTAGAKLLAMKVARIPMRRNGGEATELIHDHEIDTVRELAERIHERGKPLWDEIAWKFESILRLKTMGLSDLPRLRAALREYLLYQKPVEKPDPIKDLERGLVGAKIPGFFPTPKTIISQMIDLAGVGFGALVLEPSAGKGDIAEAILATGAAVDVVESQYSLRQILDAKGFNLIGWDFMELPAAPVYDHVLMNPPFEDGQDMDHIQHAFQFLKPGGMLVAIMSAGPFFRQDKQATGFREWLESNNGTSELLPDGAFNKSDAFRKTGVSTRIIHIRRPLP